MYNPQLQVFSSYYYVTIFIHYITHLIVVKLYNTSKAKTQRKSLAKQLYLIIITLTQMQNVASKLFVSTIRSMECTLREKPNIGIL